VEVMEKEEENESKKSKRKRRGRRKEEAVRYVNCISVKIEGNELSFIR
jgi:hypothetical protein